MFRRVSELCKEKGISVSMLEQELGFGKSTIAKWKESSPSINKIKKVADYFGVTVDSLLAEDSEAG